MPSAIKAEMVKRMAFAAMQKCPERALLLLLLVLASPASAVPLPLVCDLTSEEDPAFVIQKPNHLRQSIWSLQSGDITHSGTAVLFADDKVWNPFKHLPKPQETNRVLFVGLDNALRSWRPRHQEFSFNRELPRATAAFWEISSSCLGGRLMRT